MPDEEKKRIYNAELLKARKKLHFDYSSSAVLKKLDEYAETDDKSFFQIIHIVALFIRGGAETLAQNYKKVLPIVIAASVICYILTFSNPYNRYVYREKRLVSSERRSAVSGNIEYKISGMKQNLSDSAKKQKIIFNDEEITRQEFVKKRISDVGDMVGEYIRPITDSAGDFIDDILGQIKEMTGINNTKEGV